MPNQPDPRKRIINARIDREVYEQVKQYAARKRKTISDVVCDLVTAEVKNEKLPKEIYEQIARDLEAAETKTCGR